MTAVIDKEQLFDVTAGDSDLIREIADAVMVDTAAQIALLAKALAVSDFKRCAAVAHSAKGACGNVGAVAIAELFRSAELSALNGDASACIVMLPQFSIELDRLRIALDELSSTLTPA